LQPILKDYACGVGGLGVWVKELVALSMRHPDRVGRAMECHTPLGCVYVRNGGRLRVCSFKGHK
jgi:hypothetical protein